MRTRKIFFFFGTRFKTIFLLLCYEMLEVTSEISLVTALLIYVNLKYCKMLLKMAESKVSQRLFLAVRVWSGFIWLIFRIMYTVMNHRFP